MLYLFFSCLQVFHIELQTKSSEFVFDPPLTVLEDIVERLITCIVESAQKLSRVEHVLFPGLEGFEMYLPSMDLHDEVVLSAKHKAIRFVLANNPGTRK